MSATHKKNRNLIHSNFNGTITFELQERDNNSNQIIRTSGDAAIFFNLSFSVQNIYLTSLQYFVTMPAKRFCKQARTDQDFTDLYIVKMAYTTSKHVCKAAS